MRIHEIENKNVWRGAKRAAQVDEHVWQLAPGRFLGNMPYNDENVFQMCWVKFSSYTPQGLLVVMAGPGGELRLFFSKNNDGIISMETYYNNFAPYPHPPLILNEWYLIGYRPYDYLFINGTIYQTFGGYGYDNPTVSFPEIGKAYSRELGMVLHSTATIGSCFQITNGSVFSDPGYALARFAYNGGRGIDITRFPGYAGINRYFDFNPARIFTFNGSPYTMYIKGGVGESVKLNGHNASQVFRRIGKLVLGVPLSFTPIVMLDATFTAPQGTLISAYVPEVGPQFTKILNSGADWTFDGTGGVHSSSASYVFAAAPINQTGSVRGLMEGMVYGGTGAMGFGLFANPAGDDAIYCEVSRNSAQGPLTLNLIFDRSGQGRVSQSINFTAADGGELIGETDGSSVTISYTQGGVLRASLSGVAPSPYGGGSVVIFAGGSSQNKFSRLTVTRFT